MSRAGKYYEPGRERAKRVEDLFSRIAPRYDLINDLQSAGLHRWWKRRLVRLAEVPDRGRVLDLCCGTGDVVRALARAYPAAALVAGLDFAMPMLRIARARSNEHEGTIDGGSDANSNMAEHSPRGGGSAHPPLGGDVAGTTPGAATERDGEERRLKATSPHIVYVRADALSIPVRDQSFDRVTISYGLRNVADIDACLTEVRRVLRAGGRFLILEFGKPRNPLVSTVYFGYLKIAVPLFGRWFFGDPDTHGYIYDSLIRFPSQEETASRLIANGFKRSRVENPLFGIMGIIVGEV